MADPSVLARSTRRRALGIGVLVATVLTLGACMPLPAPSGPAPLRYRDLVFPTAEVTRDIAYGAAIDQTGSPVTLRLDKYAPPADTATNRPALVWIHGGAFVAGARNGPLEADVGTTFARKGYVVVSISYRLAPPSGGCAFAAPSLSCIQAIIDARHDALAAVRWLRANAAAHGVNPDSIAIAGASAGAITALNAASYGPGDEGTSGTPGVSSRTQAAISISGTAIPTNTVGAGDPPALLVHGTNDFIVPYSYAQQTIDNSAANGGIALMLRLEGAGHVPWTANRTLIVDQMTNFLWLMLLPAG